MTLILFSPQASLRVLAEDSMNDSVWKNLNKEEQTKDKSENAKNLETEENPQPNTEQTENNDALSVTAFDFIKMFIALAFVLFLIYFLLKFVTKRNRFAQQGQSMINLGGTSLGQNKSIQMVKVGERVLVVGVGDSISLLKEIEDENERKELIEAFEQKQEQIVAPKDIVQKLSTYLTQNKQKQSANENGTSFSKAFKEQLDNLKKERTKQLEEVKRKGLNKNE